MSDDLVRMLAQAVGVDAEGLMRALAQVKAVPPVEYPTVWQVLCGFRVHLGKPSRGIPCRVLKRNGKPLADGTVELYLKHFKPLLTTHVPTPNGPRRLGSVRINHLTVTTPDDYRAGRRSQGIQDNTSNRELTTLQTALTWDCKHGSKSFKENPIKGYQRVDESGFSRQTLLDVEGSLRMYAFCPPVAKDIGALMTYTGLRPREAIQLLKTEVDRESWKITLTARPGCKTGPRRMPMEDAVKDIINRRWSESTGPYVFTHPLTGDRIEYDAFRRWVRKSIDRQGLQGEVRSTGKRERLVPYHSRHHAVNEIASHTPIKDVAKAVGASIDTLERNYFKFGAVQQEEMRGRLNERRKPAKKAEPKPKKRRRTA